MSSLSIKVLEHMVAIKVVVYKEQFDVDTLCEVLDCNHTTLDEAIVEVLEDNAVIIDVDEFSLSTINEVLIYARNKGLDMTLGFETFVESYIVSELSDILGCDLLEWI